MADAASGLRSRPLFESRLARIVLAAAFAWALAIGSNVFQISSWMVGDIAYHRGVAYTMQGADWQGEGPFAGLLTYYGGLYPLVFGKIAAVVGQPFDTVLSVASWPLALLWPAACWWLGRRVWPGQPLGVALFVLLATTAAPFTHRVLVWVDSPLAAAQNAFPTYPRDLALVLVVVAVGCALSPGQPIRVFGGGLAVAGIVLVHLQVGLLTGWLLAVWAVWQAVRRRTWSPLVELLAIGAVALLVSSWWWVPRAAAAAKSGGLWLGGYPGAPPFRLGPDNVFMAFGVVGVLAALGLAVLAGRGWLPGRIAPFLVWMVAFVPLVFADRAVGGFDLLSERRVWLLVSIPLTVLAAASALLAVRRLRALTAVGFIVLVLVVPSLPGTVATWRLVRDAWDPGRAGGRLFDVSAWDPLFRDLNARVQAEGRHVVVTYDAYEPWVWSFSGAQVPSLWLPGPFKLGFDPERMTGLGYLDRLRAQEAAFAGGRSSICWFAGSFGAGSIVLDAQDGLLGLLDSSPASAYRVDPRDRSDATIERSVGPGVTYFDRGGMDVLRLAPGTSWQPPWQAPAAREVAIEIIIPSPAPGSAPPGPPIPRAEPIIEVIAGATTVPFGQGLIPGPARVVVPVSGVGPDVAIKALEDVDLVRVTAFEPANDLALPIQTGPVRLSPQVFCPNS